MSRTRTLHRCRRAAWRLTTLACLVVLAGAGCARDADERAPVDWRDASETYALPDVAELPDGPVVRVATWNVERFFDAVCDSGNCGGDAFEALPSPLDFELHADRVAEGIRDLDAHIVLLQEIESERCMEALRERLPQYSVALLATTGSPGGVNVGVMARGEVLGERRYGDAQLALPDGTTTTFAREFYEVQLRLRDGVLGAQPGQPEAIVFVAHFKSKRGDEPERRLAEAVGARDIVRAVAQEHPQALIVMGGDLNDTPDSEPLQAMTVDGGLVRVADDVPDRLAWTYTWRSEGRAIDHLMLATDASGSYVPGTARSVGWEAGGHAGSDHAALTAYFELP